MVPLIGGNEGGLKIFSYSLSTNPSHLCKQIPPTSLYPTLFSGAQQGGTLSRDSSSSMERRG